MTIQMTCIELHEHVKRSVQHIIPSGYEQGFRHLLESGGCEGFLRDLLAMALTASGHALIREGPLVHGSADLVLVHENIYIETKQLHLKDGTRWITNVLHDLRRHGLRESVGIVYLLDERSSRTVMHFERYRGANRRADCNIDRMIDGLKASFPFVYPDDERDALLRGFPGDGSLDLYAFAVSLAVMTNTEGPL